MRFVSLLTRVISRTNNMRIPASDVRFWPNMNGLRNRPSGFANVVEVVLSQLLPNPSRGSPLTKHGSVFSCRSYKITHSAVIPYSRL